MFKHLLLLLLFVLPHNLLTVAPSSTKTIKKILSEVPVAQPNNYLMGWYEWNELDIDEYIRTFDRTHTLCGLWGLEQLTKPITNYTVIQERQAAIAQLATADSSWYQLCKLLDDIKQHQHSVLDYYDDTNELNTRVQQLYYTSFASFLNY